METWPQIHIFNQKWKSLVLAIKIQHFTQNTKFQLKLVVFTLVKTKTCETENFDQKSELQQEAEAAEVDIEHQNFDQTLNEDSQSPISGMQSPNYYQQSSSRLISSTLLFNMKNCPKNVFDLIAGSRAKENWINKPQAIRFIKIEFPCTYFMCSFKSVVFQSPFMWCARVCVCRPPSGISTDICDLFAMDLVVFGILNNGELLTYIPRFGLCLNHMKSIYRYVYKHKTWAQARARFRLFNAKVIFSRTNAFKLMGPHIEFSWWCFLIVSAIRAYFIASQLNVAEWSS